ncbi:MAG TPA: sugar phosphate isomerase/epimerase [Sedimentisphaerales bacterium]|nr:sugar phosphate isomerase/epimerase [Sedimentisphaerales bacterium]HQI27563.1 sugar phosphate isomerase/epimerase [Sedimentisphaerales bacterium]
MHNQTQTRERRIMSRRELLGGVAAVAGLALTPQGALKSVAGQPAALPNSNFGGVQIGTITYSFRGLPGTAEDILKYVVQCGISSIELMGEPVEQFAGVPTGPRGGPRGQMTDEQRKALDKSRQEQLQWRLSAPMDKFQALRKLYNDAGVNIHIVKFGNIGDANMTDGEIDYYFRVAKALGARGITRELSEEAAKRLGPLADKHKIMIGFHNHTQMKPDTYEGPILSYGKYLGINFDIGHYVAGTNHSPIPIIEKYHERILSLHLKDRKINNGPNMPFGQGDTPVALVLQLLKREKWPIPADIELEYPVPQDSDPVAETAKCVQFCKEALA